MLNLFVNFVSEIHLCWFRDMLYLYTVGIEFETSILRFASCSDKLKVANDELQKKKAYIDSLEPKVSSSGKRINFYSLKFIYQLILRVGVWL